VLSNLYQGRLLFTIETEIPQSPGAIECIIVASSRRQNTFLPVGKYCTLRYVSEDGQIEVFDYANGYSYVDPAQARVVSLAQPSAKRELAQAQELAAKYRKLTESVAKGAAIGANLFVLSQIADSNPTFEPLFYGPGFVDKTILFGKFLLEENLSSSLTSCYS